MCSKARGIKEKNEVTDKTLNARLKGLKGALMKVLGHEDFVARELFSFVWCTCVCGHAFAMSCRGRVDAAGASGDVEGVEDVENADGVVGCDAGAADADEGDACPLRQHCSQEASLTKLDSSAMMVSDSKSCLSSCLSDCLSCGAASISFDRTTGGRSTATLRTGEQHRSSWDTVIPVGWVWP